MCIIQWCRELSSFTGSFIDRLEEVSVPALKSVTWEAEAITVFVYKQRKCTERWSNRWWKSRCITVRRRGLGHSVIIWNDLFPSHRNWFWVFFGVQALNTLSIFFVTCVSQGYLVFLREGMVWCESFRLTHLCSCIILANMGINFFLILISILTFRRLINEGCCKQCKQLLSLIAAIDGIIMFSGFRSCCGSASVLWCSMGGVSSQFISAASGSSKYHSKSASSFTGTTGTATGMFFKKRKCAFKALP